MTTVALGHTHAVQKLPQQTNSLNVLVGGGRCGRGPAGGEDGGQPTGNNPVRPHFLLPRVITEASGTTKPEPCGSAEGENATTDSQAQMVGFEAQALPPSSVGRCPRHCAPLCLLPDKRGGQGPARELLRIKCDRRWETAQLCKPLRKFWPRVGPSAGTPRSPPIFGPPIPSSTWPHTSSRLPPSWSKNRVKALPRARGVAGHRTALPGSTPQSKTTP